MKSPLVEEEEPGTVPDVRPVPPKPTMMAMSKPLPVPAQRTAAPVEQAPARIAVRNLEAGYGNHKVLKSINMDVPPRSVTAIMGPSGCGKSTFIRCINRLHEETHGAWSRGEVILDGQDLFHPSIDPVDMRRKIGMVFQRPNPFPTFTIYENVAAGLRLNGFRRGAKLDERVEKSLRRAALWDEVKDRLHTAGTGLSGGQQQRLCIARAIAVEPEILLADEPASALDPVATERIEELLLNLKQDYTILLVTHNIQQAARVADRTAFFLLGDLIEYGPTNDLFTKPKDSRTDAFISGRFG
ncbi:MAG: phosphate transporter ATP-binding protein PhoT family [Phycisphaerales bacterium]|nr:phosphate transporter ATP-binding protein PhoT family [Phycisphaerales bacterium]